MSQFNPPPAFRLPKRVAAPPPLTQSRSPTRRRVFEDVRARHPREAASTEEPSSPERSLHDSTVPQLQLQPHEQSRTNDATLNPSKLPQAVARQPTVHREDFNEESGDARDAEMPDYTPELSHYDQSRSRQAHQAQDTFTANKTDQKRRRLEATRPTYRPAESGAPMLSSSAPRFRMPIAASSSLKVTNIEIQARQAPTFNSPRPFPNLALQKQAVLATTAPSFTSTTSSTTTATAIRPRFVMPAPSHARDAVLQSHDHGGTVPANLPDIFSPHKRKHERFILGGWAAQVRGWILDVSSSPSGNLPEAFRGRLDNERKPEVVVQEVEVSSAGGGVGSVGVVRGRLNDEDIGVLIVGDGGGGSDTGLERKEPRMKSEVRAGEKLALSRPAWEVELDDGATADEDHHGQASEHGEAAESRQERWIVAPVWKTV